MAKQDMMRFLPKVDESAIAGVLADWQERYSMPGVCALLPEADKSGVAVLQAVCARHNIPLVGGIFPSLVNDGEFRGGGVWLLCFAEMPYFALRDNLPSHAAGAERVAGEIAAEIRAQLDDMPDITLFMLFDAMVPNISTLLDHIYLHLANRVHYAGGNAGSETFQPMPCLFDSQRVVQNGVLLMLLKNHHGAILEHGYGVPADTVYATSTEGNRISQIDWRPAFEVYQELVREQYDVAITPENFYQYAVHFPFGIVRANHHVVVRIPVMLAEDGSLFCVGEVPANSLLTLLEAPSVDSNETMRVLTEGLALLNGGPAGAELLLLYCAGRRMHLGLEAATTELQEFVRRTQALQVAGAVSLGEIGGSTVHGYPLFHNATLVASHWQKA
jgi:hypothetical protein